MHRGWRPFTLLALLGIFALFPLFLGCSSAAVIEAEPVQLEESEEEEDDDDEGEAPRE